MHKKLYTRAMSFFLAVLMSFTLLMPETFATGNNSKPIDIEPNDNNK